MCKELKSLQNIKVHANILEEENSHLQSQLKMTQEELTQEKKVRACIKSVHLKWLCMHVCSINSYWYFVCSCMKSFSIIVYAMYLPIIT